MDILSYLMGKQSAGGGGGGGTTFGVPVSLCLCEIVGGEPDISNAQAFGFNAYANYDDEDGVVKSAASNSTYNNIAEFAPGMFVEMEPGSSISSSGYSVSMYTYSNTSQELVEIPDSVNAEDMGGVYTNINFTVPTVTDRDDEIVIIGITAN